MLGRVGPRPPAREAYGKGPRMATRLPEGARSDPPVPAPFPGIVRLRVFGPAFMRGLFGLAKRAALLWVKPVLDLRRELGLPNHSNPMFEGGQSPELAPLRAMLKGKTLPAACSGL